jgi:hypothetical protein
MPPAPSHSHDVLFWAERAPAYYWGPFGFAALLMAPMSALDPVLVAGGMALAAAISALNQHLFVFHLKSGHIALRGAMLDRQRRIDWNSIREVRVDRVRHPLISGNGPRGRVSLVLYDGTRIGIAGVSEPEDARAAINRLLASRRASAIPPPRGANCGCESSRHARSFERG